MLLHSQRPGVGEQVERCGGGEIIELLGLQHQIAGPHQGRQPRSPGGQLLLGTGGHHQRAQQRCHQHADHQERQEPLHTTRVEVEQEGAQPRLRMPRQRACDHKARDHKKHIHPQEPTLERGVFEMKQDHRQHGDGPHPINVWPVTGSGRGGGHQCATRAGSSADPTGRRLDTIQR